MQLIHALTSLFDDLELDSNQRRVAARALVRTACRLCTYRSEVDSYLRDQLGHDKERELFRWWQSQRTNRDMQMMLWRGVYCLVETGNAEYAEYVSGIHQRDIRYALAQLRQQDIASIKRSDTLDWRKKPIQPRQIQKMLVGLDKTIKHYVYKMRFLEMADPSVTGQDIESMFKLEALSLIIRYEADRGIAHVRNTVLRGLTAYWSETISYYKREKRDGMPSHEIEHEHARGRYFEYEPIRQGLVLAQDDDGNEVENPALVSKSVKMDQELETKSFITFMRRRVPRYGKYLGLCVLDKKNRKFHDWLKTKKLVTRTDAAFMQSAKRFCGVTESDEARARKIAYAELGV